MKYLKPFNEAVTQDDIELCCVDLFDDGFNLEGQTKTGDTIILLRKTIISDMPEWDGTQGTDVRGDIIWEEHLSKYQPGTIAITGNNFDDVNMTSAIPLLMRSGRQKFKNEQILFTDEENKLISQVSDIANVLSHYNVNTLRKNKMVTIKISSDPRQNPMNFQYDKYVTNIDITFYL